MTDTQRGAPTDEQCKEIYDALDSFGRDIDSYDFGLPWLDVGDRRETAYALIRAALASPVAPEEDRIHGVQATGTIWDGPNAPDFAKAPEAAPVEGEQDLADPMFEAIWQAIKPWDLSRDGGPSGYAGANGTDVMTILQAVRASTAHPPHGEGQAVAFQVRRTDGSPLATWEHCTKDLYEATKATGRYSGFESGPPCEVRALSVVASPARVEGSDGRDAQDAARYRWIREPKSGRIEMVMNWSEGELDAAIDAAISRRSGGGK